MRQVPRLRFGLLWGAKMALSNYCGAPKWRCPTEEADLTRPANWSTGPLVNRSAAAAADHLARDSVLRTLRCQPAVWVAWVVLVLIATVSVKGRGPWDPDELKYAQVTQNMRASGDLFVPRLWGEIYPDKPPLYFWLVLAASYAMGHVTLPAMLLPVVGSACLGAWLVSRISAAWYGAPAAALAPILLVGLPLYVIGEMIGRMDMILTVCITGAVYAGYLGYVQNQRPAVLLAFALMGLGVLAKGMLGLIFPAGVAMAALAFTGKFRRLCCRETLAGILLFALLLAVWWIPAVVTTGPGYLAHLLVQQTWGRAVFGQDHGQPVFFYLWTIPLGVLPWTGLLILALGQLWSQWRERRDDRDVWLLCWLVVPCVILLLVREKMIIYLMPLMAPTAILLARYGATEKDDAPKHRQCMRCLQGTFRLLFVAGLALALLSVLFGSPPVRQGVLLAGSLLLASLGVLGYWVSGSQAVAGMRILAGLSPAVALFSAAFVLPELDLKRSWKAVANAVRGVRQPAETVATYQLRPYVGYYLNQSVVNFQRPSQLADLVGRTQSVCCVLRPRHIQDVQRYCVVEHCHMVNLPSPKGPVQVVRLRRTGYEEK